MSALLRLTKDGPIQGTDLPEGAFKPGPSPFAIPEVKALNAGQGDGRDRIRPNVKQADAPSVTLWEGGRLLPLKALLDGPPRNPTDAVVLMPTDDPLTLAGHLEGLPLIAIEFPRATDGRGFSLARLVRDRLGWHGEVRAVGDVLIDQLFYMARCGFDAFALRGDQDLETARKAFTTFPDAYQNAADNAVPLYLRRGKA
jgi:uncharacterized protein (DUF934 family)